MSKAARKGIDPDFTKCEARLPIKFARMERVCGESDQPGPDADEIASLLDAASDPVGTTTENGTALGSTILCSDEHVSLANGICVPQDTVAAGIDSPGNEIDEVNPWIPRPETWGALGLLPETLDGPPLLFEPPFDDTWIDYDGPEQYIPNERNNSISLTLGSHVNAGSVTDAIELLIGDFTLYLNAPTGGFQASQTYRYNFNNSSCLDCWNT